MHNLFGDARQDRDFGERLVVEACNPVLGNRQNAAVDRVCRLEGYGSADHLDGPTAGLDFTRFHRMIRIAE